MIQNTQIKDTKMAVLSVDVVWTAEFAAAGWILLPAVMFDPAAGEPRPPAALVAADKLLSAAWVQYVRALHGPQSEMSFGDRALVPNATGP